MSYFGSTDFNTQVAAGLVEGWDHINKFGFNTDVDSGADEDIWTEGGIWVPPTAARIHDIVSSDGNDTSAGSGARTVRVYGLDSNWDEINEDIVLNGTTNVPTVNSYHRIFRMKVLTFGSGAANAGAITATAQTDGTVTAAIAAGNGQTEMAIWTVPNGKVALLNNLRAAISRPGAVSGAMIQLSLIVTENADTATSGDLIKHTFSISAQGTDSHEIIFSPQKIFREKTDIRLRCTQASDDNSDVSGGFDMLYADASIVNI